MRHLSYAKAQTLNNLNRVLLPLTLGHISCYNAECGSVLKVEMATITPPGQKHTD
jgi:hypothetical protein